MTNLLQPPRFARHLSILRIAAMTCLALSTSITHAAEPTNVVIKDFMFSPMSMTIPAGSTVSWKNLDDEPHSVVNDAGLFRSAALEQNDTFSYTFLKPGEYHVLCGIHPYMKETIIVK